jgi:hypothetical protein
MKGVLAWCRPRKDMEDMDAILLIPRPRLLQPDWIE